ncbi:MAG: phenylacetate--CoA ligase family protein, partial [Terriglobales bacterium]
MSLLNTVYLHGVWPALQPAERGLARRLRALRRWERMSGAEVEGEQWRSLQRLLRHAQATVPFYQRRFAEAGLDVERLQGPGDLERLPPLTREDIRHHLAELCSSRYPSGELLASASGGTTDTPVPMRRNRECLGWKSAVQRRFWEWAGVGAGAKVFWLWGATSDYSQNPSWRWRLYDRWLMRQVWAPTAPLNASVLEEYRRRWNRFRPAAVAAYPTPLYHFCEYLRDSGLPIRPPRAAICTAEALLPHQRELIRTVLQCPVYEHYGSREFGMIAAECGAHQGLHLHPAAAHVGYGRVGDGAMRELLVTDLWNYGMPLIRYRINDCVQAATPAQACACGRPFALLPPIAGRTTDTFRLPDGSLVPGVSLTNRVLKVAPSLAKTQVIQESLRAFRLRYVPAPGFTPGD